LGAEKEGSHYRDLLLRRDEGGEEWAAKWKIDDLLDGS
jgi:hypothetical protein